MVTESKGTTVVAGLIHKGPTVSYRYTTLLDATDGVERTIGPLGGIQALQERAKQIGGTISLTHQNNQCTATLSWKDTDK